MLKHLILLLFLSNFLVSQTFSEYENEKVTGMVSTNDGVFLILENGYLQIEEIDPYQEYYRKIYKDSTIVNPNTELKSKYNFRIIPYLLPQSYVKNKIIFDEPHEIGFFVDMQEDRINILPSAKPVLDLIKKQNNE
ncbi:MAG: hypothetical protein H6612_13960 [Ignavibacteriales bacterium]|nr:hypothetical protein [Ignavibacteriales bacterium]